MTTINTIEIPLKKRAFNKGLLSSGLVFSLSIWILQENYTGSGLPLSVFLLKNVLALTCFVLFGAAFLLFISKIISRKMAITVSDNGIVERLGIGYSALITWDDIDFVKSATVRNEPLICLIVKTRKHTFPGSLMR